MYQSVATEGVQLISEAMEIPLLIQSTCNTQKCKDMNYRVAEGDEVEDLYVLLSRAKSEYDIEVSLRTVVVLYFLCVVQNVRFKHGIELKLTDFTVTLISVETVPIYVFDRT